MAVNGVLVPILVNGNGTRRKIIDGNYRKAIADELGYDCPEIVQAGLTEEEKRTLARALNLARRQLSNDQKRQLIADQLRETARPSDSVTEVGRRTRGPQAVSGVGGYDISLRDLLDDRCKPPQRRIVGQPQFYPLQLEKPC